MEQKEFCKSVVGKCFRYVRKDVSYPHGNTRAVRPYRFDEGDETAGPTLYCMVSFTDGYIGDYAWAVNDGMVDVFKSLKPYNVKEQVAKKSSKFFVTYRKVLSGAVLSGPRVIACPDSETMFMCAESLAARGGTRQVRINLTGRFLADAEIFSYEEFKNENKW